MAALVVLVGGCAPRTGWQRIDQVCQAGDPPRVCFEAEPDAPMTLEVGGETLVPGECAEAPKARRAGLSTFVVDGRSGERTEAYVGAGKGRTMTVAAVETEEGLEVTETRTRCR